MRVAVTALAARRGAMGRGVRAFLRALYRRAGFIAEASAESGATGPLYVELGPAYVLAAASVGNEKVTRYSVEQIAWPALRAILQWDEVPLHEARARGARLRGLNAGGRYGRHLFFSREALVVAVQVAEDFFEEVSGHCRDMVHDEGGAESPWFGVRVEAVVNLRRLPLPGLRTVSARCPRGAAHRNGDRKPSLMLWMNRDGITGGAMCPVCVDDNPPGEAQRFLTWRVMYMPDNRAVLLTPRRRAQADLAALYAGKASPPLGDLDSEQPGDGLEVDDTGDSPGFPVGGCVADRTVSSRVGAVQHMAYVTASLKRGAAEGDPRSRTVGTVARQRCPLKALLWSERRSSGPMAAERAGEVAFFARAALEANDGVADDAQNGDGDKASDELLPTQLLSVSAMKPTGWRDVAAAGGRVVSVPGGWEASAQAWVLFDLDDVGGLADEDVVQAAGAKIVGAIRREQQLSGRAAVLQTGPRGVHAWAELREVRDNPRRWWAQEGTRAWYARLGGRVLAAAHRAGASQGKVDMASCAAGRFARRPGWRLLADGSLFRARIVTVAAARVRNRAPRDGG